MKTTTLGQTGLHFSRIAFGTWQLGGEWGRSDEDAAVIATKGVLRQEDSGLVRDASPEWLRRGLDASLSALGIDHIDLYQGALTGSDRPGRHCGLPTIDADLDDIDKIMTSATPVAGLAPEGMP